MIFSSLIILFKKITIFAATKPLNAINKEGRKHEY